jgi:hypothetical protein
MDELPGDGVSTENTLAATNITTESAANDHASHAAARFLAPPAPLCCSFVFTVTTPLYRTSVSQTLRPALRGQEQRIMQRIGLELSRCASDQLSAVSHNKKLKAKG